MQGSADVEVSSGRGGGVEVVQVVVVVEVVQVDVVVEVEQAGVVVDVSHRDESVCSRRGEKGGRGAEDVASVVRTTLG